MKTKLAIAGVLFALGGCASIEELRATVGNASNFQLCRAVMLAPQNVAQIAREEAARRALDCNPYASGVLQQQQAADNATNALARQLLTPAPMPAPPRSVYCTSRQIGDRVQTVCD